MVSRIGRQPETGLAFSRLYSSIIASLHASADRRLCCFFSASICGCSFFILLMERNDALASGKKTQLDDHGQAQDGQAEIAEQLVELVQQPEEGPGEEPEPAPVHRIVEMADALAVLIAAQDVHHLGAGEQAVGDAGGAARRDVARAQTVIGLIGIDAGRCLGAQIGAVEVLALGRHDRRHPVFVGDADPAAGGGEGLGRRAGILEVAVFGVLFAAIGDADKADMQDIGWLVDLGTDCRSTVP